MRLPAATLLLLSLALVACAQEDVDPVCAQSEGGLSIHRSAVLADLERGYAPSVLEELVLSALVDEAARERAIAPPSQGRVQAAYEDFLREVAGARGFRADRIQDLIRHAGLEAYFEDSGLTPAVVKRRIRMRMLSEDILAREITLSEEDLAGAEFADILAQLRTDLRVVRLVAIALPADADDETRARAKSDADAALADLRDPQRYLGIGRDLPISAPSEGAEKQELARLAWQIPAVGECAGPIEIEGALVVMRLLEVVEPSAATEEARRDKAREILIGRRARDSVEGWWAKLRAESTVELLWSPTGGA